MNQNLVHFLISLNSEIFKEIHKERTGTPFTNVMKSMKTILGSSIFSTNELAKKTEITILPARKPTRPGLQAGASWVERKPFKKRGIVRDSHLGL